MPRFAVGLDNQAGRFDAHREGCRDLNSGLRGRWSAKYSGVEVVEAADGYAALKMVLNEEFGDCDGPGGEKAAAEGRCATFAEAGFDGRVLPCCGAAVREANPKRPRYLTPAMKAWETRKARGLAARPAPSARR